MAKTVIITPAVGRIEFVADDQDPNSPIAVIDGEGNGSLTINVQSGGTVSVGGGFFATGNAQIGGGLTANSLTATNNVQAAAGYFSGDVFINNINSQHLMLAYSIALG